MSIFKNHTQDTCPEKGRQILSSINETLGFVPNLFNYMIEAPQTVEAYLTLNKFIDAGTLTAPEAQIALLAASKENDCKFCTIAHQAIGKMRGANLNDLKAVNNGEKLENAKLQALVDFTKNMVRDRGKVNDETIDNFLDAGYTKAQVFEVILIIAIKTLSNYSNHLTKPIPNQELLKMIQ